MTTDNENKFLNIGLVMPIAPIDGCSVEHWLDVKRIITEALTSIPGYTSDPKIVSEGNSSGLIHKRIVEGLYTSDIVICDVSCKNPNVMFELGMRLAFDKPTIIIKDDQTDYTFDAGVIEHLNYPRDLRYKDIVEFKELLAEKVLATYQDSIRNPSHSPFLKSFGTFKVASIKESEVSADRFIIDSLKEIQNDIAFLKGNVRKPSSRVLDQLKREAEIKNNQSRLYDLIKEKLMSYLHGLTDPEKNIVPEIDLTTTVLTINNELMNAGYKININEIDKIVRQILNEWGVSYQINN